MLYLDRDLDEPTGLGLVLLTANQKATIQFIRLKEGNFVVAPKCLKILLVKDISNLAKL